MAEKPQEEEQDIYSENDTLDINELATLNEDISLEFIEKLQNQIAQNANIFNQSIENTELFEEVEATVDNVADVNISNDTSEDDFTQKYNSKMRDAKINAQLEEKSIEIETTTEKQDTEESTNDIEELTSTKENDTEIENKTIQKEAIENVSGGNIIEKPLTKKQEEYCQSLDYMDGNTKYSKYVIYINPENKDFIDSLTVKERKNLINNIIHEQNDIIVTKNRLNNLQTILRHIIIAVITVAIAIPITYLIINMSLEASINNYRRSQGMFQTLYREHGKIMNTKEFK